MPSGYVRGAGESIPGNETNAPTLSTKKVFFPIISFEPKTGTNPLDRSDELRNQDEPLSVVPDSFEPSWEMTNRGYPDLLGFLLKQSLGAPTTTTGNGVITDPDGTAIPTGAYRHVWTAPFGPSGASPLTAQYDVAYSDQGVYYKLKGCAQESLSIESPEEGGVQVGSSGPVAYANTQSNPSLTPTYESLAVLPFTRGNLSLPTWLSGSGTHEDFSLNIANPVEAVRSLGIASKWPDAIEKANEGSVVVTATLSQRQLDPQDLDALRDSTGFEAIARWVSEGIIASSYPYKMYCRMLNAQYVEGDPQGLANQRRHGAQFSVRSTTASTGSTIFTLVNATSSYA